MCTTCTRSNGSSRCNKHRHAGMASHRSIPPPQSESKTTAAAAMIFPFAMAWAYLVAFGEKLHDSLYEYRNSSRPLWPTSPKTSTSKHHHSTNGVDKLREPCADAGGSLRQRQQQQTQQQQTRRQTQKHSHANRLEFSLGDFLRSKLHDPFLTSCPGNTRASASTSRAPASALPTAGTGMVSTKDPPFPSSLCADAAERSSWPLRLRMGGSNNKHAKGLPPSARPRTTDKTLVLDLDETLIHARRDLTGDMRFDFMVMLPPRRQVQKLGGLSLCSGRGTKTVVGSAATDSSTAKCSGCCADGRGRGCRRGGGERQIFVRKRPHLRKFLEAVSEQFEVVLFTAARADFANAVLGEIDPARELVDHVLSRESCTRLKGCSSKRAEAKRGAMVKDLGILGRPLSKVREGASIGWWFL